MPKSLLRDQVNTEFSSNETWWELIKKLWPLLLHGNWNDVVATQAASMNGEQRTVSSIPFK